MNDEPRSWGDVPGEDDASFRGPVGGVAFASATHRFLARVIDTFALVVVSIMLIPFFDISVADPESIGSGAYRFAILVLSGVYETSMIAWRGQTLGKMAVSIRVVDASSGAIPAFSSAFIRWAVPWASTYLPVVGGIAPLVIYLWFLIDPAHQGLHDKAANTYVVTAH